jgi:hypothetical protein
VPDDDYADDYSNDYGLPSAAGPATNAASAAAAAAAAAAGGGNNTNVDLSLAAAGLKPSAAGADASKFSRTKFAAEDDFM